MGKKILKWIGYSLGVTAIVLITAIGALYFRGQSRFGQTYAVPVASVVIPTDAVSIERGGHLVALLCSGCHGENLAGTDFFNDPSLGTIHALI